MLRLLRKNLTKVRLNLFFSRDIIVFTLFYRDKYCSFALPFSAILAWRKNKYMQNNSYSQVQKKAKDIKQLKIAISIIAILLVGISIAAAVMTPSAYYVAKLSFEESELDLFVGENIILEPKIASIGFSDVELIWASSSQDVVFVDENGCVSALAAGDATVTVTEKKNGRSTTCSITVHSLDEIVISHKKISLGVTERASISAKLGKEPDKAPEYLSSDTSVATVDKNGNIVAVSPGTAIITAKSRGYADVSCTVSVFAAPSAIAPGVSGNMCVGEERQILVSTSDLEFSSEYTYKSNTPDVLTVDEKGVMTALTEGKASVTITAYNGVSCDFEINIGKEPSSVSVDKKVTAYNGVPFKLQPTDNTKSCLQFFYTSSDPDIVQVDEFGYLHVQKRGTATITCTSYNGKSAQCKVNCKIVDYTKPYTSDVVFENIRALEASYPELIKTESIGKSVQGRDITLLKLGTGEKKVLIVAGIHSRENIVVTFTMRCIEEYAEAASTKTKFNGYNVAKWLKEYTIYFVPLMNPDGLDIYMGIEQPEYTDVPLTEEEREAYKNNANGVNLNRNFPFEWGLDGVNVTTPDVKSYAGSAAASEPETRALLELCRGNDFEWLFSMHCRGHMIFYQDQVNEDNQRAKNIASRLAARYDFTLNDKSTRYEISGGFENWFRYERKNPGICVEIVESIYHIRVNEYFNMKTHWNTDNTLLLSCLGL